MPDQEKKPENKPAATPAPSGGTVIKKSEVPANPTPRPTGGKPLNESERKK